MGRNGRVTLALLAACLAVQAWISFSGPKGWESVLAFAVIPARFSAMHGLLEPLAPIFGHAFVHGGWLHLGVNAIAFVQAGPSVERRLGALRYILLYLASAAGAAFAYILLNPQSNEPAVGASGAICGVFGAYFLAARSNWRASLRDPQVVRAIAFFLAVNVGLAFIARVTGLLPIAWEAHLGGFLAGLAAYPLLARRAGAPSPWA